MLKSLKSTQSLLSIIFLQSLNIMRINYIELITLIVKSKTKFICVFVDYMIKYLFANAMFAATSENIIIFFQRSMINHFE